MTHRKPKEDFKMDSDYWILEIIEGSTSRIVLKITYKNKVIPPGELNKLENAIRLLLISCGRFVDNPSRR